jgi:exo-beta-1,3-glucanase (GH17 family)
MMRIFRFALLIVVLNGLFSYVTNLPKDIGLDVPNGKLNSLSYAPFREGQSPLLAIFSSPEQMDEDLKLLSQKTHSFRTYTSTEGMAVLPPLAQKYGLKMIQGAWIGYLDNSNQLEIDELVKAANAYPDVIKRVIVGNEVLLRGEREPEELIQYIRQVKSRIKQPVSYADVWSMYMKHPELIKEVDFITIHILPYWEDEPISVDNAPAHVERIYKQVRNEADSISPGKPILIGESGWPSQGKQRGWAIPSVVNESKFIRGLLKVAADNNFDVNIVEAFNQPWKSELEGVIGANWGLFSSDRKEVFPLTGKVYEKEKWFNEYLIATLLMVLVAFVYAKNLKTLPALQLLAFLIFIQILSSIFVFQSHKSWVTSYNDLSRVAAGLISLINLMIAALLIHRGSNLLPGTKTSKSVIVALDAFFIIVIVSILYKTYLLAVDGRYVSFPFEISLTPVAGLLGLFCFRCQVTGFTLSNFDYNGLIGRKPVSNRRNIQFSCLLILYSVGLVIGEIKAFMIGRDFIQSYPDIVERLSWAVCYTLSNCQLLGWLACLGLIALSLMLKPRYKPDYS